MFNARNPLLITLIWIALCSGANAQQFEATPPPASEPAPRPYLAQGEFALLAAPPPIGSAADIADLQVTEAFGQVDDARWREAELDSLLLYSRFEEAFGLQLARDTTPLTIALLNRAMSEVSIPIFAAKDHFQRLRPYQRFRLARVCGAATPPQPDPTQTVGSSYPSGHAAYGWLTGAILSRLAPQRATALMARANQYGQSRVVCGAHFESDVSAGQVVAAAVLARLEHSPEFRSDLAGATSEIAHLQARRR